MYYVLASEVLAEEDGSDVWPPHPTVTIDSTTNFLIHISAN